jgi:outer membrane receptor for ferric coprogen and ferric-rhodotorulic acid
MTADLFEVAFSGSFEAFGRTHEALLGVSLADSKQTDWMFPTDMSGPAFGALPPFPYAGDAIPEPAWGPRMVSGTLNQQLTRAFGATRLAVTDRLKLVAGFNYAKYNRDGNNGADFDQTEENLSPYAGLTFDFTDNILGYVSYSDLYKPQDQYDINHVYLDPTKGVNYEVGVKAEWLNKRLLTTLAWFDAEQEGLATYGGYDFDSGKYWYYGVDVGSEGFELEVTGQVNDYLNLVFGFTKLKMSGPDGDDTYPWVPRETANLMLNARLPNYAPLSFGIGGRWQSETSKVESYTGMVTRQDAYAVLNAYAEWNILPNATLRANIDNLTDEKYINSLYSIGYYGAPIHYSVSLEYRF